MEITSDKRRQNNIVQEGAEALLSIGSNLGDRLRHLSTAIDQLSLKNQIKAVSPVYETPPWGYAFQGAFLNCAILLHTQMDSKKLLEEVLGIENAMGRQRIEGQHWRERLIDIDIILYTNHISKEESPLLPHPYYTQRRFVLQPACDICPHLKDPISGESIAALLEKCPDTSAIKKYHEQIQLHSH
jgi:2-amino-4-hydroxy-6-hydroxymethyldihydropteridine diphosphokinase